MIVAACRKGKVKKDTAQALQAENRGRTPTNMKKTL
jgi:hypothetical protein